MSELYQNKGNNNEITMKRSIQQRNTVIKECLNQRKIYLLLLYPISIILVVLSKNNIEFAEWYALHIYPILGQVVSNITGIVPFSISEFIVILIPLLIIFFSIRRLVRIIMKREVKKISIIQGVFHGLILGGVLLFSFMLCGGLNYYRYTFTEYSNLDIKHYSVQELYELTVKLTQDANELKEKLRIERESDNFTLSLSMKEMGLEGKKAYQNLSETYPVLSGSYGRPKGIMLSSWFSYTEITGIYIPFTMEANVNIDIPDYNIPVTMLHEMAHQRGFMREDEANYIAYIAGMASDNLELQYSSTMLALVVASNALYKEDPDMYYKAREQFDMGVVVDLRENTQYWTKYEDTTISVMSNMMNDTYLKINDQKDGVKSYGRMVDLLLAQYLASQEMK